MARPRFDAEALEWPDFLEWWRQAWRPGDHVSVIAPSGAVSGGESKAWEQMTEEWHPRIASSILKYWKFPPAIIAHAVWLYFRFPLSLRLIEEMLLERGIVVSYETVRRWARSSGAIMPTA